MKPIAAKIREMVLATVKAEPTRPYYDIAKDYNICEWMVRKIARDAGHTRPRGAGSPSWKLKEV